MCVGHFDVAHTAVHELCEGTGEKDILIRDITEQKWTFLYETEIDTYLYTEDFKS